MATDPTSPPLRAIPTAPAAVHPEERSLGAPLVLAGFGMLMFVAGAVLLAVNAGLLADPASYTEYALLGTVHVLALGFVTSMIMAVLYQFVPASFHANVRGVWRTRVMAGAYVIAVLVFVTSLALAAPGVAAVAGPLLALAVALFLSQMAGVVRRAKRRPLVGGFHITAFLSLSAVIVLGALLATSLGTGWMPDPLRWLAAKVFLAVGGWVGLAIVGVSYHTVRGLNGSRVQPALVPPALACAVASAVVTPVLLAAAAPAWSCALAASPLVVTAVLYAADVARMVRGRAPSATAVTWAGQVAAALILVVAAVEAVLAAGGELRAAALAVSGVLLGTAPLAIAANGNRILPVLIGTRFRGRGRGPLSAAGAGAVTMPTVVGALVLAWGVLQAGILAGSAAAIRAAAAVLLVAALLLAVTAGLRALRAARESRVPLWTVAGTPGGA